MFKNMENMENFINIQLTDLQYDYLKEVLNCMYNELKKFPKKMRTHKFYILENLINKCFSK